MFIFCNATALLVNFIEMLFAEQVIMLYHLIFFEYTCLSAVTFLTPQLRMESRDVEHIELL